MKTLDNLKSLGYDVEFNKGNIKLSYKGEGAPDKNRVLPLIQELKANKSEVIKTFQKDKALKPIPDETLRDIYLEVMNEINDSYISGTIKFVEENHPGLDRQIDEVDEQINEIWESCLQDETSLNDFEKALNTYQNLYLEGIDLYKSKIENEKTV